MAALCVCHWTLVHLKGRWPTFIKTRRHLRARSISHSSWVSTRACGWAAPVAVLQSLWGSWQVPYQKLLSVAPPFSLLQCCSLNPWHLPYQALTIPNSWSSQHLWIVDLSPVGSSGGIQINPKSSCIERIPSNTFEQKQHRTVTNAYKCKSNTF